MNKVLCVFLFYREFSPQYNQQQNGHQNQYPYHPYKLSHGKPGYQGHFYTGWDVTQPFNGLTEKDEEILHSKGKSTFNSL